MFPVLQSTMTYYDYFRKNETVMLTIPQFVTFMENDVFHNDSTPIRSIVQGRRSQKMALREERSVPHPATASSTEWR